MFFKLVLSSLLLSQAFGQKGQGADGNPHGWDRKRRCDHTDYNPPCGICEGYGGIPTGDENDEIKLTTCTPIANASSIDPTTLKRPIWARSWSSHSWEILIGPKRDPFCFQTFPSNSSIGKLCYRPQTGIQNYDFEKARAIREDIEISTSVGNVTTMLIHQGPNMWIVNKLPWYAAGVHQCICGQILRMWQPFNGLQVFPKGMNYEPVNSSMFEEIPPALCKKKGGATFRIKCTDDGYPQQPKKDQSESQSSFSHNDDEARAKTKVPRKHYRGDTFSQMSEKLNGWLLKDKKIPATKHCSEWNVTEIQQLQGYLFLLRHEGFDEIYKTEQDNRRFRGALEDLQRDWERLNTLIENEESTEEQMKLHDVVRDGHCHEAVMWYVHHLTADVKAALSELPFTLPLLSFKHHGAATDGHCHPKNRQRRLVWEEACKVYEEKVTCASCHSNAA
eukprot:g1166.t1